MNVSATDRTQAAFCFFAPQAAFCFFRQGAAQKRPSVNLHLTDLTKSIRL
jgi:hypothetical protein